MRWLQSLLQKKEKPAPRVESIRNKLSLFLSILDTNHQILRIMSEMEGKAHGEHIFSISYIDSSIQKIQQLQREIIDKMVTLGNADYEPLRHRFETINTEIQHLLSINISLEKDEFILPFDTLDKTKN